MKHRLSSLSPVIRLVCALALVLVGFAHKVPAAAAAASQIELADYVLPDGSFPVLCLSSHDEDGGSDQLLNACEACLISSAVLLPVPPLDSAVSPNLVLLDTLTPPRALFCPRHVFPPNAAPRAPPAPALI
ncbi:hypothetical protein J2Y48_002190 [Mycoplana sp. BE70]|uniref:hypothetical protein n=1 Tax=Mycoplana sp. BE70 TaxID=2817775 RepID=UPI00285F6BBE|nr:hypothetical protein [Mycoplana sp. BE70]MDR6756894.1 hypothetical protein [Mycoplana sp. BE70]